MWARLSRLWRRQRVAPEMPEPDPPHRPDPALARAALRAQQLHARLTYMETEQALMTRRPRDQGETEC